MYMTGDLSNLRRGDKVVGLIPFFVSLNSYWKDILMRQVYK